MNRTALFALVFSALAMTSFHFPAQQSSSMASTSQESAVREPQATKPDAKAKKVPHHELVTKAALGVVGE